LRFTQFLFPNGERKSVMTEVPADIERMAEEVVAAGFRFEIECHPETQLIHMDCCDDDEVLTAHVCLNGPEVPSHVRKLVTEAHAIVTARRVV
jgi:uncharacterized protein (DUF849 family)